MVSKNLSVCPSVTITATKNIQKPEYTTNHISDINVNFKTSSILLFSNILSISPPDMLRLLIVAIRGSGVDHSKPHLAPDQDIALQQSLVWLLGFGANHSLLFIVQY